jgi:hypothetical protein
MSSVHPGTGVNSVNRVRKIPFRRFAVEITVIVASILLAFAIDAWWADRGEQSAKQVLLKRLKADFLELRTNLDVVELDHNETRAACLALLEFPEGEALPETAEVDQMVAVVFLTSRTFNPGSGAMAAFLNGEGANLIDNQPLADLLLSWSGLVEELQEEDSYLQKGVAERWIPFLKSRTSIGPYLGTYGELVAGLPLHVTEPVNRTPLMVDQQFINNVLDRFKSQQIALRDIKPVSAAVERILELIEAEIGDP